MNIFILDCNPGHAGNALNERADILANRGVDLIRGAK